MIKLQADALRLTRRTIVIFALCFVAHSPMFGQSGCSAHTLVAPVTDVRLAGDNSLRAKSFAVRLGSVSSGNIQARLASLLSVDEFLLRGDRSKGQPDMFLRKPTHNFDCSWLTYTVVPMQRGFYVIVYVAPNAGREGQMTRAQQLAGTFKPLTDGPDGPALNPFDIAPAPSGTSECISPRQDFKIACPSNWAMSQDSEGGHFLQVNWSSSADPTASLHVTWYSYSTPARLKDGSLYLYASADDFTYQWLTQVFGLSEYTANPSLVSSENPREQLTQLIALLQKSPNDEILRNKLLDVAVKITPPPAVPAEARQHFMRAAALMQLRNPSPNDIQTAITPSSRARPPQNPEDVCCGMESVA